MTTKTMTSIRGEGASSKDAGGGASAKRAAPARSFQRADLGTDRDSSKYRQMVAQAAYFKAQEGGFGPGFEAAGWLAAEHDLRSHQGWE